MSKLDRTLKYFQSNPPTYDNGSTFLGFRVPGGQTFTDYAPPSDTEANLAAITGQSGYKLRQLLQSPNGTEILREASNGKASNSVSYLGFPGYQSKASCQQDSDCGDNQICYSFNNQTFGPKQGPSCSPTIYPEIALGNNFNDGKPLRQYSNYCQTDNECTGIDEFSGKPKVGMSCNHYYKGPNMFEKTGLCHVQYESKGQRYHLETPPGWIKPLNDKLNECKTQSDCGPDGVNGWVRCVGGSSDGKQYCVWPGRTYTPNPRELKNVIPSGMKRSNPPSIHSLDRSQAKRLNLKAEQANSPGLMTPGGILTNVRGPIPSPSSLHSRPEPSNVGGFK